VKELLAAVLLVRGKPDRARELTREVPGTPVGLSNWIFRKPCYIRSMSENGKGGGWGYALNPRCVEGPLGTGHPHGPSRPGAVHAPKDYTFVAHGPGGLVSKSVWTPSGIRPMSECEAYAEWQRGAARYAHDHPSDWWGARLGRAYDELQRLNRENARAKDRLDFEKRLTEFSPQGGAGTKDTVYAGPKTELSKPKQELNPSPETEREDILKSPWGIMLFVPFTCAVGEVAKIVEESLEPDPEPDPKPPSHMARLSTSPSGPSGLYQQRGTVPLRRFLDPE
jgi:hypothetical protein